MTDPIQEIQDKYEKILSDVMRKNNEQLEKYCAAFFNEVGSKEASKYVLVQQTFPDKIQWRFEPQSPNPLDALEEWATFNVKHHPVAPHDRGYSDAMIALLSKIQSLKGK